MLRRKFYSYLEFEKRYSKHTLTAYANDLSMYYTFLQEIELEDKEVKYREARFFLSSLREKGRSVTSINRMTSSLRSFYRFLQREGFVEKNPFAQIKALKEPKKLPVIIEKEKMVALLDHFSDKTDFASKRNYVVLELLFGTGIRLSELLQLKYTDFDFLGKKILILGKRNKQRYVPLYPTLVKAVEEYEELKQKQNFEGVTNKLIVTNKGKEAYPKMIYNIVKNHLEIVTSQKNRSPHILRHSFATSLLNEGADLNAIKELLGHAGLAATQIYTHNSVERLKSIYKQAHPKA
ncbi:MAG TPA: tyrosine-type recombinase/integrase [Sphingobacterium sp.]|nr:tyrosine-type recombinase/integrase [Sphingobacterium sp.]